MTRPWLGLRGTCILAVSVAVGAFLPLATPSDARSADRHGFEIISSEEFDDLKKSLLFTDEDVRALRMSRAVLEPHVEDLLDVWYGFVASHPHLVRYFSHPTTSKPDGDYLAKVRTRFREWVLTTADAKFDQDWLELQLEIGLRHHRLKKNKTDGVHAVAHIPFRHLVAFHYPISTTLEPFLRKGEHSEAEVAAMHEAWRKAVLLTTILWSQPYVAAQDF